MRVDRAFVLLAGALVLAGCTDSSNMAGVESRPSVTASADEVRSVLFVVHPNPAQAGQTPRAILRNTGTVDLSYEPSFTLERKAADGWKDVRVTPPTRGKALCAVASPAFVLEPGDNRVQRIWKLDRRCERQPLPPGRYRMTKTVGVGGTAESMLAETFFTIAP